MNNIFLGNSMLKDTLKTNTLLKIGMREIFTTTMTLIPATTQPTMFAVDAAVVIALAAQYSPPASAAPSSAPAPEWTQRDIQQEQAFNFMWTELEELHTVNAEIEYEWHGVDGDPNKDIREIVKKYNQRDIPELTFEIDPRTQGIELPDGSTQYGVSRKPTLNFGPDGRIIITGETVPWYSDTSVKSYQAAHRRTSFAGQAIRWANLMLEGKEVPDSMNATGSWDSGGDSYDSILQNQLVDYLADGGTPQKFGAMFFTTLWNQIDTLIKDPMSSFSADDMKEIQKFKELMKARAKQPEIKSLSYEDLEKLLEE